MLILREAGGGSRVAHDVTIPGVSPGLWIRRAWVPGLAGRACVPVVGAGFGHGWPPHTGRSLPTPEKVAAPERGGGTRLNGAAGRESTDIC